MYRKFVQSLGFSYLNVDSTLFVWDQILLKPAPQHHDMQHAFVALMLAAREELMLATKFSDFVELIYLKGKAISIDTFISKYIRVAAGGDFYTPRWNYEEIPVEAIKLDKISLGHKIGTTAADGQLKPVEDKLIEDNMDRILKENVLPEDQEVIPQGEGLLLDPSLLKDLDKEAAMNTGKSSKSTKGKKNKAENDPLMGDYKSVKKAGTKDGSSKRSEKKGGDDILSDMPKPDKKKSGGKAVASSKDGKNKDSNKTFSLPQSDTIREPSKKKPGDKTNKSSKRSGGEEDAREEQSGVKKSDSKKNIRKPAIKSKDKDKSESPAPSKRKVPPPPKKKK